MSIKDNEGADVYFIEHSQVFEPYGDKIRDIKRRIEAADILIGFNIKFDLHWIQRYVPDICFPSVYDVQLAHFVLGFQRERFPSLDMVSSSFGLASKLDVVKVEYWDNGIDTDVIPTDVLEEYARQDVLLTELCAKRQWGILRDDPRAKVLGMQLEDLLVLQEIEQNGLFYDRSEAALRAVEIENTIADIDRDLTDIVGISGLNFDSDDVVSACLYGGMIYERYREHYERILKDGTVRQKERWSERVHEVPRMVKPIKGTELAPTKGVLDRDLLRSNEQRFMDGKRPHQRLYSVGEPILKRLRPTSKKGARFIELIAKRGNLSKLVGTYYRGLIELCEKMEWDDQIHGQFNQCAVVTSRLSCSNPNQQNFDSRIKELFYSRYV